MSTAPDRLYHMGGVPVGGDILGLMDTGQIYYVDPESGESGNDGSKPSQALDTLEAAYDKCAADRGDVIIRSEGSESVSAAVALDTSGVTIIGATWGGSQWNRGEKFAMYAAAGYTTGPVLNITAPTRIIGMEFWSRDTSDGYSVFINGEGGGFAGGFGSLSYCRFVGWGTADWGIYFDAGAYWDIYRNFFDGLVTGGIALSGSASNNPTHLRFVENEFHDCTYAIDNVDATPHNILVKENVCIDSKLMKFNGAGDGLVCGNWLETATDTDSYDVAVATAQGNGWNFSGNNYSE